MAAATAVAKPPVRKRGLNFKIEYPARRCAGTTRDKLSFLRNAKADTVCPRGTPLRTKVD